ncbi:circadian clock KaiB family protein [Thalassospiraceae bacterium LMO-JJ14]|nr:circadian clock KaiB family protein [Thalassospiraceae bacterium LMO-JJ14]
MQINTPRFNGGHLQLEIYIAGNTPAGERAIANIHKMCEEICVVGAYEIKIINIHENPKAAEAHNIMATPTIVRRSPQPVMSITGDMNDIEEAIIGLGLITP